MLSRIESTKQLQKNLGDSSLNCKYCGSRCENVEDLNVHMLTVCFKKYNEEQVAIQKEEDSLNHEEEEEMIPCEICASLVPIQYLLEHQINCGVEDFERKFKED